MKNKKDKNNFDVIQNVTDKSKGLLKNTFGSLFRAVDKIYRKKDIKENEYVEEEYIEVMNSEDTKAEEPNFAYDDDYENKFITDIKTEESEHIEIKNATSIDAEDNTIEIKDNSNSIVLKYLGVQKVDIKNIKDDFNNADSKDKRAVLVTGIHNFLNKTINIDIESLELEDKTKENICTIIILNNRLRSLRQILRKENKDITFYDTVDESNINEIIDDAEYQIKMLKQEFIMEFYYDMDRYKEADDIMTEFSSIEYQITSNKREADISKYKIDYVI